MNSKGTLLKTLLVILTFPLALRAGSISLTDVWGRLGTQIYFLVLWGTLVVMLFGPLSRSTKKVQIARLAYIASTLLAFLLTLFPFAWRPLAVAVVGKTLPVLSLMAFTMLRLRDKRRG